MLVSSLIGAAGALGSAIYGGIKSSQANKRAQKLIQNQRDENQRWYNTKMNQDYTLRTDVQNAITRQRELLDEQLKRANARKVVGGGSDESAALAKEAANKSVADATADIAAAGANYKDRVEAQYRAQDAALNQQQVQGHQQQAAQTAAAASQAVNAGLGLIGTEGAEINLGGNKTPASTSRGTLGVTPNGQDLTNLGGGGKATLSTPATILDQEQLDALRQQNIQQTNS